MRADKPFRAWGADSRVDDGAGPVGARTPVILDSDLRAVRTLRGEIDDMCPFYRVSPITPGASFSPPQPEIAGGQQLKLISQASGILPKLLDLAICIARPRSGCNDLALRADEDVRELPGHTVRQPVDTAHDCS
jgi:hypothetical protein